VEDFLMSFFGSFTQNVSLPTALQSTANINAGNTLTLTGSPSAISTLGVNAIQVNIAASQNCTVYVDQSEDGTNWDISDPFVYIATPGGVAAGDSWTVQATASCVQVRVKNEGAIATTFCRVQTALCPMAVPTSRAVSDQGNLPVGVYEFESDFLVPQVISPMGAAKTTDLERISGQAFSGAVATPDASYWTVTAPSGGTAVVGGGQVALSTGTTSASVVTIASVSIARYVAAYSNTFRGVVHCPAITGANTRQWGAANVTDGFFFEQDSALGLSVVCRKGGLDTNKVTTGAFNGNLGAAFALGTNVHTYEIFWTSTTAWFKIDGKLLHRFSGTTAPLVGSLHLPILLRNANGANTNNNVLNVRSASISRLGKLETQPRYTNISTPATTTLKTSPGTLHRIIVNNAPNTGSPTVTIYDNTSASAPVVGTLSVKWPASQSLPVSLDYGSTPFFNGLTVVTSASGIDITVVYE
jgi:hypothetical protein